MVNTYSIFFFYMNNTWFMYEQYCQYMILSTTDKRLETWVTSGSYFLKSKKWNFHTMITCTFISICKFFYNCISNYLKNSLIQLLNNFCMQTFACKTFFNYLIEIIKITSASIIKLLFEFNQLQLRKHCFEIWNHCGFTTCISSICKLNISFFIPTIILKFCNLEYRNSDYFNLSIQLP